MSINSHVVKGTMVGALGGLLFGFDTAVISGTTQALTSLYHLSPLLLGVTVFSALLGTVIAALSAGIPGQRYGRRDLLRVMAFFYVISALGCGLAWNWPALIVFRFIGGLGIGGSSVLAPMYIAEIAPPKWRVRSKGQSVGSSSRWIKNAIISLVFPIMYGNVIRRIPIYILRRHDGSRPLCHQPLLSGNHRHFSGTDAARIWH